MENQSLEGRSGERGFALVLAILSLMLLTFLGLTMATTTSTELQIATNYRWSQQALYNAEAGLEAARVVLSRTADVTTQWTPILPAVRTSPASWLPGAAPLPSSRSSGGTSTAPTATSGAAWATAACSPREPSGTRTSRCSTATR